MPTQRSARASTIVDVASEAGVSISTVSHVINGTRPVGEQARQRVLSAVKATGYSPHGVARALRRARTDTVGLVMTDTGDPTFAEMVRGVEHRARELGKTAILMNSSDDARRELDSLRLLRERRVDGVLVSRVPGSDAAVFAELDAAGIPMVQLDRLVDPDRDSVVVENACPVVVLVGHLVELGHCAIAYVSIGPSLPTLNERWRGYEYGMSVAGLPVDAGLVVVTPDMAVGQSLLGGLWQRGTRPTAIVTADQRSTWAVLHALRRKGLRVPRDVALVVFDDPPLADVLRPRLTAAVQPAFEMGREAMELLERRLSQPDAPAQVIRLGACIVHRESCGCSQEGRAPDEDPEIWTFSADACAENTSVPRAD